MKYLRRWFSRSDSLRRFERRAHDRQAAPEFLFERHPFVHRCRDRKAGQPVFQPHEGPTAFFVGPQLPYCTTRREEHVISRSDVPSLTITSDPCNSISLAGTPGPDWEISFCAEGEGEDEEQAAARLNRVSMTLGHTVALTGPGLEERHARAELIVKGPIDAGVTIHSSYSCVEVRDMAGPVRVAATHARARILGTTGPVDVTAGMVDFAGSSGRVILSAESEVNLKITSRHFEGTLTAWAQRSVRLIVPTGFETALEAMVCDPDDFVCRAALRSKPLEKRLGELHVFTCGVENGPAPVVRLRSEAAAVVIDAR